MDRSVGLRLSASLLGASLTLGALLLLPGVSRAQVRPSPLPPRGSGQAHVQSLGEAQTVELRYEEAAPARDPHLDRDEVDDERLPDIPVGPEVPLASRIRPAVIQSEAGVAPRGSTSIPVVQFQNMVISPDVPKPLASPVEPSIATNGSVVFCTGNLFAALSVDGGKSFKYVAPTSFPNPGTDFCCDQIVQYVPQLDRFLWLQQYKPDQNGGNIYRLAYATTANVKKGKWTYKDFKSTDLAAPGYWMDFPDLSFTGKYVYFTANVFKSGETQGAGSVVTRFPLTSLTTNTFDAVEHILLSPAFGMRLAQNCGTRQYWVSHYSTSAITVWYWDEGTTQYFFNALSHASFNQGPFTSTGPDQTNWLGGTDVRITAAALDKSGVLWAGWAAAPDAQHSSAYADLVRIDTGSWTLLEQPSVYVPGVAIAYPAFGVNADGEVGVSLALGGGSYNPSHAVAMISNGSWLILLDEIGTNGPNVAEPRWGDYFTVRPHQPNTHNFVTGGYTLQGGGDPFHNPVFRYVVWGRSSGFYVVTAKFFAPGATDGPRTLTVKGGSTVTLHWDYSQVAVGKGAVSITSANAGVAKPKTGSFKYAMGDRFGETTITTKKVRTVTYVPSTVSEVTSSHGVGAHQALLIVTP